MSDIPPLPGSRAPSDAGSLGHRGELAKAIPRRPRVSWWLGLVLAFAFSCVVTPTLTADRWLAALGAGAVVQGRPAGMTLRVPAFAGYDTADRHLNGGVVIARGQVATAEDQANADAIAAAAPRGALPYVALFLLTFVFGAIFTHHMRRSNRGRLVRVQVVGMVAIAILAVLVKILLLVTAASVLVVPVAVLALVPTLALDRIVGLATGILAALVIALLGPFDVGVAILMLVQASVAGLVVAEQPKDRWRAVLVAGGITTLFTGATYFLLTYLTTGHLPVLHDPLHAAWLAAAIGPAIATVIAVPLLPLYQLLVGEITRGKLVELEDLSNPLLRQIAERSPGTWQHSLMMANMAEIAANAIGASGRLVRVGAYYHDLGKSLQPKYFIENLEPGETSPHDQLPPEVSCDAIFAHVTEGIVAARKAGLHERIVDFMHMHHGNGVLEYFWGKTKEQGNPRALSIEQFRYPGHPPQSRETAILAICDAVEAASRTLKKPDPASIDSLVQRIVYGKLHLGQLDESGLSMSDLRRISDSLRETIRHANHGRIEYPWQKAKQDASAIHSIESLTSTGPRLDSLDRPGRADTVAKSAPSDSHRTTAPKITDGDALAETAELRSKSRDDAAIVATVPALVKEVQPARATGSHRIVELTKEKPASDATQPATARARAASAIPPTRSEVDRAIDRAPEVEPAPDSLGDVIEPPPPDGGVREPDITARWRPSTGAPTHAPPGPPPDLITPSTFGEPSQPAARKRAATLPPTPLRRAPTIPPLVAGRRTPTIPPLDSLAPIPSLPQGPRDRPTMPSLAPPMRRPPTMPPLEVDRDVPVLTPPERRRATTVPPPATRTAGPPAPVDLDSALTNPPPLRQPALLVLDEESRSTGRHGVPAIEEDARATGSHPSPSHGDPRPVLAIGDTTREVAMPQDAGATEPSMPRFDAPVPAGRATPPPPPHSLAARIDAALQADEWGTETPVKAPTRAELRALLGNPDPTRQQSLDELEELHRKVAEDPEPEILHRRIPPLPTAEVDPDDIEAAIEIAPPARRHPNSIAVAKGAPKKSD